MRLKLLTLCIALLVGLSSCSVLSTEEEQDILNGQITEITVDCGGWGLQTQDELYELVDLPEKYRTDGLLVQMEIKHRKDLGSCTMVGPIIEVLNVEKLD